MLNTQFVQLTLPLMLIVALDAWLTKKKYKNLLRQIDNAIEDLGHKRVRRLLQSGSN